MIANKTAAQNPRSRFKTPGARQKRTQRTMPLIAWIARSRCASRNCLSAPLTSTVSSLSTLDTMAVFSLRSADASAFRRIRAAEKYSVVRASSQFERALAFLVAGVDESSRPRATRPSPRRQDIVTTTTTIEGLASGDFIGDHFLSMSLKDQATSGARSCKRSPRSMLAEWIDRSDSSRPAVAVRDHADCDDEGPGVEGKKTLGDP